MLITQLMWNIFLHYQMLKDLWLNSIRQNTTDIHIMLGLPKIRLKDMSRLWQEILIYKSPRSLWDNSFQSGKYHLYIIN